MSDTDRGRIGVGIVGLTPGRSWAARAHVPALRALDDYRLVGIANTTAESARAAAEALQIDRAFDSVHSLANDPEVDLVAVTVKVPHHREVVDTVFAAGKMLYCEWPLGNGLDDAEAMAARARDLGVRTAVGLQARCSPAIRFVRDLVRDGYVGDVLSTTLVGSSGSMGASDPEHLIYLNDRANGANVLTIPFAHALDAVTWVLGEVREVSATLATRRPSYVVAGTSEVRTRNIADQVLVTGVLDTDVVFSAHYRGGTSRATNFRWEINGTDGDLVVTAPSGHCQVADLELAGARADDTSLQALPVPPEYRHVRENLTGPPVNVAEAYLRFSQGSTGPDPLPDFDDAVRLHRVLDAIERSASRHEAINHRFTAVE